MYVNFHHADDVDTELYRLLAARSVQFTPHAANTMPPFLARSVQFNQATSQDDRNGTTARHNYPTVVGSLSPASPTMIKAGGTAVVNKTVQFKNNFPERQ